MAVKPAMFVASGVYRSIWRYASLQDAYEIFKISGPGDMITHLYHANGPGVLGADGKVLPLIRDAERRGVLFDIGFGSFNFSWDVATACFAQDLRPHIVSSDPQQFGVVGPVFSLAHIIGIFKHLGMTVSEVVDSVTWAPAKALSLTDRAGSLRPGLPADITVFRTEAGTFSVADTYEKFRPIEGRIAPVMAFKRGVRYDSDVTRCQDERNWVLMIAEDHVPEAAGRLSRGQIDFLAALAGELERWTWSYSLEALDLDKATALQAMFRGLVTRQGISLHDALKAVFDSFLDSPFTIQIGLFLLQLDRDFALRRLRDEGGIFNRAAIDDALVCPGGKALAYILKRADAPPEGKGHEAHLGYGTQYVQRARPVIADVQVVAPQVVVVIGADVQQYKFVGIPVRKTLDGAQWIADGLMHAKQLTTHQ